MYTQAPASSDVEQDADVIIVGAGAAGATLAARLSEDARRRVLLIEAGRDTSPEDVPEDIDDPFPRSYSNPAYMWPGLKAQGLADAGARDYTQARVMGGGSSLTAMWGLRGLAADYDRWRDEGADGWSWQELQPCFDRLTRGAGAPMPTRQIPEGEWPGYVRAMKAAAQSLGYPAADDLNAVDGDGFFPIPLSQQQGVRLTSSRAFLTPVVRQRPNLRIVTDTEVTRLDVDGTQVRGVFARSGERPKRFAAREVLVSAGAIHSPALLLRSGIGPAQELERLGVRVQADCPGVGKALQNHACINIGLTLPRAERQRGGLHNYGVACLRASSGVPSDAGDLLLAFIGRTSLRPLGARISVLGVFLYAPSSRGSVTLARDGERLIPDVRFNLLAEPADESRIAAGLRLALDLLRTPAAAGCYQEAFMLPASAPLHRLNRPGLLGAAQSMAGTAAFAAGWSRRAALATLVERDAFLAPMDARRDGPERLRALARACTIPMFHPAGTCAMGPANRIGSVVDSVCRVHGMQGLRVVDASVMPHIPRANTNLPTIMLAERAAQLFASAP